MSSPRCSTHSSLEPLEARIAPAAITVSPVANGVLKISALDASTAAQVSVFFLDADTIQVSDGGSALAPVHGVHSIKITLGDQADSLDFFGAEFRGPISISSGAGQDVINFHGADTGGIFGDVSVVAKGNALVTVQDGSKITGTLSVTTGAGGAVAVATTVGGLTTTNVASVSLIPDSYVAGNVRVIAPATGVVVTTGGTIGGSLMVKGSTSASAEDTVHLNGVVNGPISLVLGDGGSSVDSLAASFMAGDNVTISGKGGPDTVNLALGSSLSSTGIGGSLKISLGDGTNSITINGQARIDGGIRTSGGTGDDSVSMTYYGNVGGVARFDLGAGTNSVALHGGTFNGGLVVTAGAGSDGINVGAPGSTIAGPAKFLLGDGANTVTATSVLFGGGLSILGGKDNDIVTTGGSNFRGKTLVSLGEGTNSFAANFDSFRSSFTYLGRAGNDSVNIDVASTLTGAFTMNAGDGANLLVMGTLGDLSSFNYNGGKDADLVDIAAGGGFSNSNPLAGQFARGKVVLGDGADLAFFRNSAFLAFTIDGGGGLSDIINHTALAFAAGPMEKGFETINVLP